jgi:hypothetical protein
VSPTIINCYHRPITAFLLLLIGICLFTGRVFAQSEIQPPAMPASNIDPDGDDERTELLYHWQDKRFSDEEQRQISFCSLLIATVVGGGAVLRKNKRKQAVV